MADQHAIEDLFVCVGAQKAGTTWLARMLGLHPEIFVTPVKELHYFDHQLGITNHLSCRKRRSRYRKYHQRLWTQPSRFRDNLSEWRWWQAYMRPELNDVWYRSLFNHRGAARFAVEATPEYALIGSEGYERLLRLAPHAKLLFILRDPRAQLRSKALHHCRAEGVAPTSLSMDAWVQLLAGDRFRELTDYAATLQALEASVPAAQFKIMFYEDIHADRRAALDDVCSYIGTEQAFPPSAEANLTAKVNVAQPAQLPDELDEVIAEMAAPIAERVQSRLGRLPQAWAT